MVPLQQTLSSCSKYDEFDCLENLAFELQVYALRLFLGNNLVKAADFEQQNRHRWTSSGALGIIGARLERKGTIRVGYLNSIRKIVVKEIDGIDNEDFTNDSITSYRDLRKTECCSVTF